MEREEVAKRLIYLRNKSHLTQEEVATGIGIKRSTYAAYEEARSVPNIYLQTKMRSFYGFNSIDGLLGLKQDEGKKISELEKGYHALPADKRAIVDFILFQNRR